MNYQSYLDLDELAKELRELEEAREADCSDCDGLGEVNQICQTCEGTGWYGPADIECTDCYGEGVIAATCLACNGEGTRPSDDFDPERYDALKDLDSQIDLEQTARNESQAIADYAFEEYAEELACDIGAVSRDNQWPLYCIDWARAADDLKQDYMSFSFEDTDWWVRSY